MHVVTNTLLQSRKSLLWIVLLYTCVSIQCIPASLVELRYYVIPTVIVLLHDMNIQQYTLLLTIIYNMCINMIMYYIFIYKSYAWPDGSIARFMW